MRKIDVAEIDHAIQQFNVEEGRNPKDLNELVTMKYLGKLPPVPYGSQLKYDAVEGKVTVVKKAKATP